MTIPYAWDEQDLASWLVTVPMEPRDLRTLRDSAVRLLKAYTVASAEQRTPILRELAVCLVEARQHFARSDGSPDWTGRTWPYRQYVRDVYDEAGIAKADLNTVQSKTRYHISATLREFLDEETLQEYGLAFESQRDKSKERRTVRTAQLNAFTARDAAGGLLMSLSAVVAVLDRIELSQIPALADEERGAAMTTLALAERRLANLRRELELDS